MAAQVVSHAHFASVGETVETVEALPAIWLRERIGGYIGAPIPIYHSFCRLLGIGYQVFLVFLVPLSQGFLEFWKRFEAHQAFQVLDMIELHNLQRI
jgi:hypothetical protein